MKNYTCKACGWWLVASDKTEGVIRARCRNRTCNLEQTVHIRPLVAKALSTVVSGRR